MSNGGGTERVPDVVETVQSRLTVLERLLDGPVAMRDLVEQSAESRSTLNRAIRSLEDAGFVERVAGGYRTTLTGRLAAERCRAQFDAMRDIEQASPALEPLGPEATLAPQFLVGAETHVATDPAPYRVEEPITAALEEAVRYRSLNATIPEPDFLYQVYERTLDGELDGEAVVSPMMHEALQADFAGMMADLVGTDGYRILVAEGLAYGLLLVERPDTQQEAFLVVPDDQGRAHAVVANDTPAAVRWAEEHYRTVRERARDVTDTYRGSPE